MARLLVCSRGRIRSTILGVFTGSSVSALTTIAVNDDVGGGPVTSLVTFNAVSGTAYKIAVDGYNGATGNINLSVSLAGAACSYSLSSPSASFSAASGSGSVSVSTGSGCTWSPT